MMAAENVGHDAYGKQGEAAESTAGKHVEHVQDGAALLVEEKLERDRVDARNRDEGSDPEHHERTEDKQETLLELRRGAAADRQCARTSISSTRHEG